MKALCVIVLLGLTATLFSFIGKKNSAYSQLYFSEIHEFANLQSALQKTIATADGNSEDNIRVIRREIDEARIRLKNVDFWLRYFEPNAYRKINGPLPVEWENEVFEKFEKPYRREGAGLSLLEISLNQPPLIKDSLLRLVNTSLVAVKTFESDSITSQLSGFNHFFLANRLFLLNLAAIYTTGFECPDTSRVIIELKSMLSGTKNIYDHYNQSFPEFPLSGEYLDLYKKTITFVNAQPDGFSAFDQFRFHQNLH